MPFDEKFTWVGVVVTLAASITYSAVVFSQVGTVPIGQIAYQLPMILAIAAVIVFTIAGTILAGIGTGIAIELSGDGSVEDLGRTDERDQLINRRGVLAGYVAASGGAIGTLAITMLGFDHFWIANTLFLSFVAASLVSGIVKLIAYRRGF